MNNNNNSSNSRFWIAFIVLVALGAWPIAIPMLIWKLFVPDTRREVYHQAPGISEAEKRRQEQQRVQQMEKEKAAREAKQNLKALFRQPKDDSRTAKLLKILGFVMLAFSMLMLLGMEGAGFWSIMFLLGNFFASGTLIYSGFEMNAAMNRYTRYMAIIGSNQAVNVETLAAKSGYSTKRVEKDLERMLNKGMFGSKAYLNKELGYLFMSSEADDELENAKMAAMKKTEEAAKAEAAKQTASVYDKLLMQIRDVNDRIPGEVMTEKIYKIEDITRKIFDEVRKEPAKRGKIDRFMTYYIPTTLKLLEHYAKLDSTNVEGENITQSKKSIESAMDSIVAGFEHQLDEMYKTETLDIETDIEVMQKMMDRETGKSEIKLGGTAAQTK